MLGSDRGNSWENPSPACFLGLLRECFSRNLAVWIPALCLVQEIKIWLSLVSSFYGDKQGCGRLPARALKGCGRALRPQEACVGTSGGF